MTFRCFQTNCSAVWLPKSTPPEADQTDDAEQDHSQCANFGLCDRFLEKQLGPEHGADVTGGNHGVEDRKLAVADAHDERDAGTEVEYYASGQAPVEEIQNAPVEAHGSQLQEYGTERANHGTEENQQNGTERGGIQSRTLPLSLARPIQATPQMTSRMPITFHKFIFSLKKKTDAMFTQT